MTAANTPQPRDTVVPSAAAERRRIWQSESLGITIYAVAAGLFALAVVGIVLLGR